MNSFDISTLLAKDLIASHSLSQCLQIPDNMQLICVIG